MKIIRELILLITHARYRRLIKQAHIHRVPAPVLGTQIRSYEVDHSGSFGNWGEGRNT